MAVLVGLKKVIQFLMIALGCLQLTGGPMAALQCFAWARMLVMYAGDSPLPQAVRDTFSGEKPCELCVALEEARQEHSGTNDPARTIPETSLRTLFMAFVIPAQVAELPRPGTDPRKLPRTRTIFSPPGHVCLDVPHPPPRALAC